MSRNRLGIRSPCFSEPLVALVGSAPESSIQLEAGGHSRHHICPGAKPGPCRIIKIFKKSPPAMWVNAVALVPMEAKGNYKLEKIKRLQVGKSGEETAFFC